MENGPHEGVIKFDLAHSQQPLAATEQALIQRLSGWRQLLAKCELIGQTPELYEGAGYGNLSLRPNGHFLPPGRREFLITGTQTSGRQTMTPADYAWVKRYDYRTNAVESEGLTRPSSEAMTHGAVYDLEARIEAVFHGHSAAIWQQAAVLGLPTTAVEAAYGTPQMALEVRRLYRLGTLRQTRIFAMGGHEDGVVAFGTSAEEAGTVLMSWLARALAIAS